MHPNQLQEHYRTKILTGQTTNAWQPVQLVLYTAYTEARW